MRQWRKRLAAVAAAALLVLPAGVTAAPEETVALHMLGAGIRPASGDLRFAARLEKTETVTEYRDEWELGVLIVPESLLAGAGYAPDELTLESAEAVAARYGMSRADIVFYAAGIYAEDADSLTFTGVFPAIPREQYDTPMVGRAFARRGEDVWYADPLVRTFYGVAEQAATCQSDEQMAQTLRALLEAGGRTAAPVIGETGSQTAETEATA